MRGSPRTTWETPSATSTGSTKPDARMRPRSTTYRDVNDLGPLMALLEESVPILAVRRGDHEVAFTLVGGLVGRVAGGPGYKTRSGGGEAVLVDQLGPSLAALGGRRGGCREAAWIGARRPRGDRPRDRGRAGHLSRFRCPPAPPSEPTCRGVALCDSRWCALPFLPDPMGPSTVGYLACRGSHPGAGCERVLSRCLSERPRPVVPGVRHRTGLRGSMSRGLALMMSVLIVGPLLLVAVPSALAGDDTPSDRRRLVRVWPRRHDRDHDARRDPRGRRVQLREEPRRRRRRAIDHVDIPEAPPQQAGTVHLGVEARRPSPTYFQSDRRAEDIRPTGPDTLAPLSSRRDPPTAARNHQVASTTTGRPASPSEPAAVVRPHDHRQQRQPELVPPHGTLRVAMNVVTNGSFESPPRSRAVAMTTIPTDGDAPT